MSIYVMNNVWRHSRRRGGELLVLLAIADCAHDDGGGAFPSVATLSRKARMTPRNVQLCLRQLQKSGELIIHEGQGPNGTNMYAVTLGENFSPDLTHENSSPGELRPLKGVKPTSSGGVKPASPKPSIEPINRHSELGEKISPERISLDHGERQRKRTAFQNLVDGAAAAADIGKVIGRA